MYTYMVTQPRLFIRERSKYRKSRLQLYIAIATGIAFALQYMGSYYLLGDAGIDFNEVIIISTGAALLAPFILWIVATVLIGIAARLLGRRLTLGYIFRLSGWGLVPLLLGGLVQSLSRLYAIRTEEAPEISPFAHLGHEWEVYHDYLAVALDEPVYILGSIVAVGLVIYTGYIWTLVVEQVAEMDGFDLRRKYAIGIAAIPTVICLLWVISPFLLV